MSRTQIQSIKAAAGSKGGKATARKGKDFLIERATKGGIGTLSKYGAEYYAHQLGRKPVKG